MFLVFSSWVASCSGKGGRYGVAGRELTRWKRLELETKASEDFTNAEQALVNPRLVVVKMGPHSVLTLKAARPL